MRNPQFLEQFPGRFHELVIPSHERLSFAPAFSECFFKSWGGPRVPETLFLFPWSGFSKQIWCYGVMLSHKQFIQLRLWRRCGRMAPRCLGRFAPPALRRRMASCRWSVPAARTHCSIARTSCPWYRRARVTCCACSPRSGMGQMIFCIHVYIDTSPECYFRFRFRTSEGN